jgi:GntP family gluconate:H+ symporter
MDPLILLALGVAIVLGATLLLKLEPFLALLLAALIVGALTPSNTLVGERVAKAFGKTAGDVGIMIGLAAVIGKCMMESGAADRIVRSGLKLLGEARAPLAFSLSGFLLGIPVFFDTVFYLMIPLGKATAVRTGRDYGLYVMTIIGGATIAHSLVPPTPGPLFAASELKVPLEAAILGGIILGGLAVVPGYFYALWVNRRWPVAMAETPDLPLARVRELAERDERELPPLGPALLPIALPVALIALAPQLPPGLGERNTALAISALVALGLLARAPGFDRARLAAATASALAGAGSIVLVTSAGGAFGAMIDQTGVGATLQRIAAGRPEAILPLAFLATAVIRTAQGSATVAMLTVVGMLKGAADPAVLGFHPLYLALAIGFGSKLFSWMNDSGFWIVTRMSGMTTAQTLRCFSTQMAIMGLAGLGLTVLAARLVPLTGAP